MRFPVKKIVWSLIGVVVFVFICMSIPYLYAIIDRTPSIPRQKRASIGEISESIDFSILYPDIEELHQTRYNAEYFLTTIPNPSGTAYSKPVVTGYSILLRNIGDSHFSNIEYRGTSLERENGYWTLFDEINYTYVKHEMSYEYADGLIFYYSEYRPYPYNDYEVREQKGLSAKPIDEFDESTFTVFHAYVESDGIRYDVIYSDLPYTNMLETECIENASDYFEKLLWKE